MMTNNLPPEGSVMAEDTYLVEHAGRWFVVSTTASGGTRVVSL